MWCWGTDLTKDADEELNISLPRYSSLILTHANLQDSQIHAIHALRNAASRFPHRDIKLDTCWIRWIYNSKSRLNSPQRSCACGIILDIPTVLGECISTKNLLKDVRYSIIMTIRSTPVAISEDFNHFPFTSVWIYRHLVRLWNAEWHDMRYTQVLWGNHTTILFSSTYNKQYSNFSMDIFLRLFSPKQAMDEINKFIWWISCKEARDESRGNWWTSVSIRDGVNSGMKSTIPIQTTKWKWNSTTTTMGNWSVTGVSGTGIQFTTFTNTK